MAYKREDGRKNTELRPMSAQVGVIPNADGSARFQIGHTIAIAAVYGPRELHPQFLQDPMKGVLRCNYNMMAFSGSGDRVRPGPSRRSKEISLIMEKSLLPVLDLSKYAGSVVDVFVELLQTDAGTRCAAITAASMALADAGIPMKDLVTAVACGRVEDQLIVDVDYLEDSHEGGVDLPMAMSMNSDEITLLQMDGVLDSKSLKKLLEMGKEACLTIKKVQLDALKKKYGTGVVEV